MRNLRKQKIDDVVLVNGTTFRVHVIHSLLIKQYLFILFQAKSFLHHFALCGDVSSP